MTCNITITLLLLVSNCLFVQMLMNKIENKKNSAWEQSSPKFPVKDKIVPEKHSFASSNNNKNRIFFSKFIQIQSDFYSILSSI